MRKLGFTLIELLVSVAIIGIMASIAVANFEEYRVNAYKAVMIAQLKDIITSIQGGDAPQEINPALGGNFTVSYEFGSGVDPTVITLNSTSIPINSTNINKYVPAFKHHRLTQVNAGILYSGSQLVPTGESCHCKMSDNDFVTGSYADGYTFAGQIFPTNNSCPLQTSCP